MSNFEDALYVLDSYGLIYRSYYAFISRPLINKNGENVSAIFGFFRNLKSILDHYKPKYLVAAFDSRVPTFRHEFYSEYKATRQKTPEDLHAQVPVIEEILKNLGIPVLYKNGFEADDVIATLSEHCCRTGRACRILSADKDLMQLVGCNTQILKPNKAGGWEVVGAEGVFAEWGVYPEKMLDLLSLIGDTADNVPGVPGVGIKTALKLLNEYNSLDGIFEHAEEISGAIGNKIRAGRDSAYFSKKLIMLRNDVPLEYSIEDFSTNSLNYESAAKMLLSKGVLVVAKLFGTVIEEVNLKSQNTEQSEVPENVFQKEEQDFETFTKNTGDYKCVTEISVLKQYIDNVLSVENPVVAFDCETDGLDCLSASLVGFSLCYEKGSAIYIPLIMPDMLLAPPIPKVQCLEQLERIFSNSKCTVVMHNGKFDYKILLSQGLSKPVCKIWDTMIAAWILETDRASYSLESLAAGKLGLETISYDSIVPKGATFADVPLEQAVPYGAEDADLTFQLYQLFKPRLIQGNLLELFENIEMQILPILAEMELNGIHIEKEELAEYGKELELSIEHIKSEIFDLVGHEFNIASTKQLQQVLFEDLHLPTGKKTKSGYSTDTAVLENLATLHPVPKKILDFRGKSKLLSTYVEALPKQADKNNFIHTSFIQTGTATGRLSCRDPNLQNIPIRDEEGRRIRRAFTSTKGKVLISADYSQIELVILAHLSGDESLCNAFNQGVDVHKSTAALIYGVTMDAVTSEMRRVAKTINFGVMYGMSAFRLANELGISRTQAQSFIEAYFTTYSGVQNFMNDIILKAEKSGYVETIFGRRRYVRSINSKNKLEKSGAERIAINTPIQGSAADIVKQSMINVVAELKEKNIPAKLLLQVHDELIFECSEEMSEEAIQCIQSTMESVVKLQVPLKVSVEKGQRWGDFH